MKPVFLGLLLLLLPRPLSASGVFLKDCPILSAPSPAAQPICEKRAGTPFNREERKNTEFWYVETADCAGYVRVDCTINGEKRTPASLQSASASVLRIGPSFDLGALFATAGSASTSGDALVFGLRATVALGKLFRLTLLPSYQILSLSRSLDLSGNVLEASQARFTQKISFAGAGGRLGLRLLQYADNPLMASFAGSFWIDTGLEYLHPLQGIQTDSTSSEVTFSPSDKLLLIVTGITGEFLLSSQWVFGVSLQYLYNLGSTAGSRLSGVRVAIAVDVNL